MTPRERRAIRKVKSRVNLAKITMDTNPIEEYPNTLIAFAITPFVIPTITRKHHKRASFGLELKKSMTQEVDFNRLRSAYAVPDDFRMIVPSLEERVVSPPFRCVAFYEDTFKASIRFPLHPFILNLLDFYTVTPTQFTPNGFRVIVSFMLVCVCVE